tara:strand:+ start:1353 stop:1466 length:114 start_codon:yes stop_codon:yes gene_type:complete
MPSIKIKIIGKNVKESKELQEHIKKIFDNGYTYDNKK